MFKFFLLFKQINEHTKLEFQQTEKYYQFRKWLCTEQSIVNELMHAHRFIDVLHELNYYYQYMHFSMLYGMMCKKYY